MSKGIFGNLFDFNGDGKLDMVERASELAFLNMHIEEEAEEDEYDELPDEDPSYFIIHTDD